jgi:hypothetical protein
MLVGINICDTSFYRIDFTDKKPDYLIYGVKVENLRRVLLIRSPYVIFNHTSKPYRLRFMHHANSSELKSQVLFTGQAYPL